jgi:hypothetical protein
MRGTEVVQRRGAGVEPKANGSTRRDYECERRELNPHPLRDRILSPARLPVSPRSRGRNITVNASLSLFYFAALAVRRAPDLSA